MQEVFVDPARDESLIIELQDLKMDVADSGSATWFLQDLVNEQEAEGTTITEQSALFEAPGLCYRKMPAVITTAVGQMAVSKGRQGREAQNLVKVYLANIRLKEVGSDVLIIAYEPLVINPLSESATTAGPGMAVSAAKSGVMPIAEVFKQCSLLFQSAQLESLSLLLLELQLHTSGITWLIIGPFSKSLDYFIFFVFD